MDNLENAINEAKLEFDKKLEAIYNEYLFGTIFKLKTKEYIDMNGHPSICTTLVKCLAIKNNEIRLKVIPYQFDPNYRSNSIIEFPLDKVVKSSYSYIEPEMDILPGCTWCSKYVKVSGIIDFE